MSAVEAISLLGTIDHVEGLNVVQTLRPRRVDEAPPNTYSGNFGTDQFPLHTDLAHWAKPPRFLALRCVTGAANVATRILDSDILLKNFGAAVLRRTLVQPRRPLRGRKHILRILDVIDNTECIRWDSIYLRPASANSGIIFSDILSFVSGTDTNDLVLESPGDTLLVDNWRMIHGRTLISEQATSRHIERIYIRGIK